MKRLLAGLLLMAAIAATPVLLLAVDVLARRDACAGSGPLDSTGKVRAHVRQNRTGDDTGVEILVSRQRLSGGVDGWWQVAVIEPEGDRRRETFFQLDSCGRPQGETMSITDDAPPPPGA